MFEKTEKKTLKCDLREAEHFKTPTNGTISHQEAVTKSRLSPHL